MDSSKKLLRACAFLIGGLIGFSVCAADLNTEIGDYEYKTLLRDVSKVDENKISPFINKALEDGKITTQEKNIIGNHAKELLKQQEQLTKGMDAKQILKRTYG